MVLEKELSLLGELEFSELRGLDDPAISPCDVLVIGAEKIPVEQFLKWLAGVRQRMVSQGGIWIPALIVADLPSGVLHEALPDAVKSNWYFDIVSPQHMSSIPIRVANLLRLHDHLHEMRRYSEAVDHLQSRVNMLESQVRSMSGGGLVQ
jgi:hypothetical protein